MYQPRAFREEDRRRLEALVERHSFGMLVVAGKDGAPEIAHVPFLLDRDVGEHGRLRLHVARANPIWKLALAAGRVTAVFTGPHAYVSPRHSERPEEHVPTWNYAVVHAHGTPEELSPGELRTLLDDLSRFHEGDVPSAWNPRLLEPALKARLHAQIVGLSIRVESLEGKFKLSQNRSEVDRARVVAAFDASEHAEERAVAELMKGR